MSDFIPEASRPQATRYRLVPHPDLPPSAVEAVDVDVIRDGDTLLLTFMVEGNDHVALPDWVAAARTDDLWKTTCCELFLGVAAAASSCAGTLTGRFPGSGKRRAGAAAPPARSPR